MNCAGASEFAGTRREWLLSSKGKWPFWLMVVQFVPKTK
jgi:hypothetical protein